MRTMVFALAFAFTAPLFAGAIGLDFTGQVANDFTDTHGYFGGGTISAGTSFSGDFSYDPTQCSGYSSTASPSEFLNICATGSFTADFFLNGHSYSVTNDVNYPSVASQDQPTSTDFFTYNIDNSSQRLSFSFGTTDGYVAAVRTRVVQDVDPNSSDNSYAICAGGGGSCEFVSGVNVTTQDASAPEPSALFLIGTAGLVLLPNLRRRFASTR